MHGRPRPPARRPCLGAIRHHSGRSTGSGRGVLAADSIQIPAQARLHQPRERLLAKTLLDKYKIWTNAIDSPAIGVQGVRVTPHVFIQPAELDVLVKAISEVARA